MVGGNTLSPMPRNKQKVEMQPGPPSRSRSAGHLLAGSLTAFVVLSVLWLASAAGPATAPSKIQGVVFTGPASGPLEEEAFASMREVGATHVALVPEATVNPDTLEVRHPRRQWYGETREATEEGIRLARAAGLKVMIKPHLVVGRSASDRIGRGIWRGDFDVEEKAEWPRFAAGYREFVLPYARLAEQEGVEIFCVGTELKRIALSRPEFWREVVREVRRVYGGELTYAANWDSFDRIRFWDAVDLIGVDAYFPVSDARNPQPQEIAAGWGKWVQRLAAVQERFDRPVVFTEWGYELEDHAGKEPWVMDGGVDVSDTAAAAQAAAYEGTFRSVWNEPWMRGIFVWRWSPRRGEPGRYSPRGQPAEEVLRRWFTAK